MHVGSQAWHSGLRIWCCNSCGMGLSCGWDLIPGPGTPYAAGQAKKKKRKEKKKKANDKERIFKAAREKGWEPPKELPLGYQPISQQKLYMLGGSRMMFSKY